MSSLKRFSYLLVPLAFFFVSIITLYDYGINWDSPTHFARGQAYLRYILTGKTNYEGLPNFCTNQYNLNSRVDIKTGEICDRHRKNKVSEYESNLLNYERWAGTNVYGHPAFSNLMLAIFNNVFFKTLGWVEDIQAYHLYSVFITFILAVVVSLWTRQTFGILASIFATIIVYTYPLLFGEQHFNIKDPPMAAFFTLCIYLFYLGLTKKRPMFLIFSALAGGASFGTKFNFVFAPFILFPWVTIYLTSLWKTKLLKSLFTKKMVLAILLYPAIVFSVFYFTWPALWTDPIKNVPQVFFYYKDIGGSECLDTFCFKLDYLPLQYLVYTMQPLSLILFGIGFFVAIKKFKEHNFVTVLWLSFFLVTMLRVTLPISTTYGGIRQILEFIGPFAMIAGLGASWFVSNTVRMASNKLKQFIIPSLLLVTCYLLLAPIVNYHPNQNVYFNSFIGGLKGAAAMDFPGFGNTYGNVYFQGVTWLNKNAKPKALVALVSGNTQNIPRSSLREDLDFANGYRSGFNQVGEYQMSLTTGQEQFTGSFRHQYLDSFVNPVYDLKVDGISILKIWENSKEHLKTGVDLSAAEEKTVRSGNNSEVILKLTQIKPLKALILTFKDKSCKSALFGAEVSLSQDGSRYIPKDDEINGFTEEEMKGYKGDLIYLFTGDEAQFIKIKAPGEYNCKLSDINFAVFTFTKLFN